MPKQRFSLTVLVGVLIGVGYLIVRRRLYPEGDHLSAIERDGLVACLLLGGSFVVLRSKHEDAEFYSAADAKFDSEKRIRTLTYLGWFFLAVGLGFIFRVIAFLVRNYAS